MLSSTSSSDGKSGWKSVVAVSGRFINESSTENRDFLIAIVIAVTVEPPIKDTLNKGHSTNNKNTFDASIINLSIVLMPLKGGQPLYNGQNDSPQCVCYLEVTLY